VRRATKGSGAIFLQPNPLKIGDSGRTPVPGRLFLAEQVKIRLIHHSGILHSYRMSITPQAIQDLLDELEASKQSRLRGWNVPLGSFRGWKRHGSATGPEDLRCGGRNSGTCFDEISPDSERGKQADLPITTILRRARRSLQTGSRVRCHELQMFDHARSPLTTRPEDLLRSEVD
jgi:hypothetical protein